MSTSHQGARGTGYGDAAGRTEASPRGRSAFTAGSTFAIYSPSVGHDLRRRPR